jgi:hypothetical protein
LNLTNAPKGTRTRKLRKCKYGVRDENGKCPKKPNEEPNEEPNKDIETESEEFIVQMPITNKTRKLRKCKYGVRDENGKCPKKPNEKNNEERKEEVENESESEEIIVQMPITNKTRKLRKCKYGDIDENGKCPKKLNEEPNEEPNEDRNDILQEQEHVSSDKPYSETQHTSTEKEQEQVNELKSQSQDNDDLKTSYNEKCSTDKDYYSTECNAFQLKKELYEHHEIANNKQVKYDYLYPNLNDPNFNIHIATKKEFNDTKYDGQLHNDIKKYSDEIANAEYELQPHQAFVKNFMSFQTPYSSLLLYHGLGTGKTCSAIGVGEDMREFMKQTGNNKRILIVATENVQDNFKLQLFDERKLVEINGIWTIQGCLGNKLLKEINPTNMKMSREKIITSIKHLINQYYIFLGYIQFANYIIKTMTGTQSQNVANRKKEEKSMIQLAKEEKNIDEKAIQRLQHEFNDRLIIIDEIHNIRKTSNNLETKNHLVATNLEILVHYAKNMRLLLLSATPMYNTYTEIVWLLNLMNINDRRGKIEIGNVFDQEGNFKKGGEELLIRKATGYVSFVRGENPYTFPYRVYPSIFDKDHSLKHLEYPTYQMNLKKIKHEDKIKHLDLYVSPLSNCSYCGSCQWCCYQYILYNITHRNNTIQRKGKTIQMLPFKELDSIGYNTLILPIESLIISYPPFGKNNKDNFHKLMTHISTVYSNTKPSETFSPSLKESTSSIEIDDDHVEDVGDLASPMPQNVGTWVDPNILTGKMGFERIMRFEENKDTKHHYEYIDESIGRIYSREHIGKYSIKIKRILDNMEHAEGIILIYSSFIDGGIIPMALALEESGYVGYNHNLFKEPTPEMKKRLHRKDPLYKYCMITGDGKLSPNNDAVIKVLTNVDNKKGDKIKVVLISKAGSEGVDFKFIRQIHILDPWYNMNRIEQVIGRGVRNLSHKDLEFEKRNVCIFLHAVLFDDSIESADLYIYRVAEYKAIQIGKITRLLKETAIDCIINHEQTNFTQQNIKANMHSNITQIVSSGKTISDFRIGDAPFSHFCDYMASCNYNCRPNKEISDEEVNEDTYDESFIHINSEKIIKRIRMLFKEAFFYKKDNLIRSIRAVKPYSYVQIYSALTNLIEDENEFITDKYDRNGKLVNIGDYYLFQPVEITDKNISIYQRTTPLDFKMDSIVIELDKNNNDMKNKNANKNMNNKNIQLIQNRPPQTREHKQKEKKELATEIIQSMQSALDASRTYYTSPLRLRGDDDEYNWYKYCGAIVHYLKKEYEKQEQRDKLVELERYYELFSVSHYIEMLNYNDKITLMNYIYSLEQLEENSLEAFIKQYFDKQVIKTKVHDKDILVFIIPHGTQLFLKYDNESYNWIDVSPYESKTINISKEVVAVLHYDYIDKNKTKAEKKSSYTAYYNSVVGYMGFDKGSKQFYFKTRTVGTKRDKGATCFQAAKKENLTKINNLLGYDKYTSENTKMVKDSQGNIIKDTISNNELCVLLELIYRLFHETNKNDKKWVMSPELASILLDQ